MRKAVQLYQHVYVLGFPHLRLNRAKIPADVTEDTRLALARKRIRVLLVRLNIGRRSTIEEKLNCLAEGLVNTTSGSSRIFRSEGVKQQTITLLCSLVVRRHHLIIPVQRHALNVYMLRVGKNNEQRRLHVVRIEREEE